MGWWMMGTAPEEPPSAVSVTHRRDLEPLNRSALWPVLRTDQQPGICEHAVQHHNLAREWLLPDLYHGRQSALTAVGRRHYLDFRPPGDTVTLSNSQCSVDL